MDKFESKLDRSLQTIIEQYSSTNKLKENIPIIINLEHKVDKIMILDKLKEISNLEIRSVMEEPVFIISASANASVINNLKDMNEIGLIEYDGKIHAYTD